MDLNLRRGDWISSSSCGVSNSDFLARTNRACNALMKPSRRWLYDVLLVGITLRAHVVFWIMWLIFPSGVAAWGIYPWVSMEASRDESKYEPAVPGCSSQHRTRQSTP